MVSFAPHQEHTERTRHAIMRAASELFAEVGYQKMTIDGVAKRANLGKGTIYLYFASKQELALSILDQLSERVRERLRAILDSEGTPEERLKRMLMARVLLRFDYVRHYKDGVDQMFHCLRPQLLERKKGYVEKEAVSFVEILVEGKTLAAFQCGDPLRTAHALITATSSLLPYSLSPVELGSRDGVEEQADFLSDLLIRAIKTSDHMKERVRPGFEGPTSRDGYLAGESA